MCLSHGLHCCLGLMQKAADSRTENEEDISGSQYVLEAIVTPFIRRSGKTIVKVHFGHSNAMAPSKDIPSLETKDTRGYKTGLQPFSQNCRVNMSSETRRRKGPANWRLQRL
jgi:hypothetical protein